MINENNSGQKWLVNLNYFFCISGKQLLENNNLIH